LGGTLSGEHGIGLVQKDFMPLKYTPMHFAIWKGIKAGFDPNGILNPGVVESKAALHVRPANREVASYRIMT
jgi:FAD/FMN-containing dehydrogenase